MFLKVILPSQCLYHLVHFHNIKILDFDDIEVEMKMRIEWLKDRRWKESVRREERRDRVMSFRCLFLLSVCLSHLSHSLMTTPPMSVFICVCTYSLFICTYAFANTCMCECAYSRVCIHSFLCVWVCGWMCVRVCVCVCTCASPEQAEPPVKADRPEGCGAGEGRAAVLCYTRPAYSSVLWGPTSSHHHLQHRGLCQPHHPILRTWVPFYQISFLSNSLKLNSPDR